MPTKRCCWGTCNSDIRYADLPHMQGVTFRPFPKPKSNPEEFVREWIRLCDRGDGRLKYENINIKSHHYVCSKHFKEGSDYPEPAGNARAVKQRKRPTIRSSPPPKKKRTNTALFPPGDGPSTSQMNVGQSSTNTSNTSPSEAFPPQEATTKRMPEESRPSPTTASRNTGSMPNFELILEEDTGPIDSRIEIESKEVTSIDIPKSPDKLPVFSSIMHPTPEKEKIKTPIKHVDNQPHDCIPLIDSLIKSPKKSPCLSLSIVCKFCKNIISLTKQERKTLYRNDFVNNVLLNDNNCFYYTGIPTVGALNAIYDWLSPSLLNMTSGKGREYRKILDYRTEFLMILIKIRRGLDNRFLADCLKISKSTVTEIFSRWIPFLDKCFSPVIRWPSKEICKENLPNSFSRYPRTRGIIDCTEYTIDRPFMPVAQRLTYSNYKHRNTLKQLIAIMPTGCITYVSKLYGGSVSDVAIVEKSGFLDKVEEGDDIMADRGFNIRHLLLKKRATLNIPAFSRGKVLSRKAVVRSRKIAAVRIHVERAIRRMKTFKILNGIITLKLRRSLNSITRIVAFLSNLQEPLVPGD